MVAGAVGKRACGGGFLQREHPRPPACLLAPAAAVPCARARPRLAQTGCTRAALRGRPRAACAHAPHHATRRLPGARAKAGRACSACHVLPPITMPPPLAMRSPCTPFITAGSPGRAPMPCSWAPSRPQKRCAWADRHEMQIGGLTSAAQRHAWRCGWMPLGVARARIPGSAATNRALRTRAHWQRPSPPHRALWCPQEPGVARAWVSPDGVTLCVDRGLTDWLGCNQVGTCLALPPPPAPPTSPLPPPPTGRLTPWRGESADAAACALTYVRTEQAPIAHRHRSGHAPPLVAMRTGRVSGRSLWFSDQGGGASPRVSLRPIGHIAPLLLCKPQTGCSPTPCQARLACAHAPPTQPLAPMLRPAGLLTELKRNDAPALPPFAGCWSGQRRRAQRVSPSAPSLCRCAPCEGRGAHERWQGFCSGRPPKDACQAAPTPCVAWGLGPVWPAKCLLRGVLQAMYRPCESAASARRGVGAAGARAAPPLVLLASLQFASLITCALTHALQDLPMVHKFADVVLVDLSVELAGGGRGPAPSGSGEGGQDASVVAVDRRVALQRQGKCMRQV